MDMRQFIVEGTDQNDNLLYVVRAKTANEALTVVGGLTQMKLVKPNIYNHPVPRVFLCKEGLTPDALRERIQANPLGEAGRGCYEVHCRELKENVNLA